MRLVGVAGEARARNLPCAIIERIHHGVCNPRRAVFPFAHRRRRMPPFRRRCVRSVCVPRPARRIIFFERGLYRQRIVVRSTKGRVTDEVDGDDHPRAKRRKG